MGAIVTFTSGEGTGQGYLALPRTSESETAADAPAVIVIQEWWAGDPHIRAVADRFAAAGFVALAPDLYRGERAGEPRPAARILMGLATDRAAAEIGAAARYLLAEQPVGTSVGVVGFRMGGSLALWSANRCEEIDTAVSFYPVLPWERMAAKWDGYRDRRAVVHTAEPPPEGLRVAADAVASAGGSWQQYTYPAARDGFFNDDRPATYAAEAATLAWARTLEALRPAR